MALPLYLNTNNYNRFNSSKVFIATSGGKMVPERQGSKAIIILSKQTVTKGYPTRDKIMKETLYMLCNHNTIQYHNSVSFN